MRHLVHDLLNNSVFLFLLCYSLVVVPTLGIMYVHQDTLNEIKENEPEDLQS